LTINLRRPSYEARRLSELARALGRKAAFERHDSRPRFQIEALQRRLLRDTVEHAVKRSAFYRQRYRGLDRPETLPLTSLPVVTKANLMDGFDDWVTDPRLELEALQRHLKDFEGPDGYYLRRYRVLTTGGSSGRKGIFVFSSREWSFYLAHLLRFMDLVGVGFRPGHRIRSATIAAGHPLHATYRGAVSADVGAAKILRLEATSPVGELTEALNEFQPEWLHAYPSIAAMLADQQTEGRLRIEPRVVSTSSELRSPEMTERIAEAWGRRPHDMYGITEAGIFGMEC